MFKKFVSLQRNAWFFLKKNDKYEFSSKRLNERTLEACGEQLEANCCNVLRESAKKNSTNIRVPYSQHVPETYKQTKKGFSHFNPKTRGRRCNTNKTITFVDD